MDDHTTAKARLREIELNRLGSPTQPAACQAPPPGWACTRGAGHAGPCAAVPADPEPAGRYAFDPAADRMVPLAPATDAAPPGPVPAREPAAAAVPWQTRVLIAVGLSLAGATAVFLFLGRLAP